jgi:hypothetical protein
MAQRTREPERRERVECRKYRGSETVRRVRRKTLEQRHWPAGTRSPGATDGSCFDESVDIFRPIIRRRGPPRTAFIIPEWAPLASVHLDAREDSSRGPHLRMDWELGVIASSFLISRENRVNTQSAVIFGFSCSHTLYRC